jgi:antibiotic biosynthesis monooxygenase (ABM) superfamily enzyme
MAQSYNFSNEPVTAVFSWTVKEGKEKVFEAMMHDMYKVARTFPGHMGVTTIKSPSRKHSFQIVLRFDNAAHLEAWLNSPVRQKMLAPLERVAHTEASVKASGMETWFEIPGQQVVPPPKWKMVVTTFIAIYPVSLLYALYLAPNIVDLPAVVRALFLPIIAPIILTYLFMPFLTQRVLNRWLYKRVPS